MLTLKYLGHVFGLFLGLMVYLGFPIALYISIYGEFYSRLILALILIYQYFFQHDWDGYRKFVNNLAPYHFFKEDGLIFEEEIEDKNTMVCLHPHGILVMGLPFSCLRNEKLFRSKLLASRSTLLTPLSGLFSKWLGVNSIGPSSFKGYLKKGQNVTFSPGGFEEATISDHRKDKIFIKKRKGFIKYALEYGYTIHPAYTFNENKAYYTFNGFEKFRLMLNKLKIPTAIFWSKFLVFPNPNIRFYTVVGKAIKCPHIEKPTTEEIDLYHQKYMDELIGVYNRYKGVYGGSESLEVY